MSSSCDFGAVVIRLKATPKTVQQLSARKHQSAIHAFMGSATHSTFYESIKEIFGETVTTQLHDQSMDKPFSASDLFRADLDQPFRGKVQVGTEVWVRWVGLSEQVLNGLEILCPTLTHFRLDHCDWQVTRMDWDNRIWGQRWHTAHVIEQRSQPAQFIRVQFITPTVFKSGGVEPYLHPEPYLVFGEGVLRRWIMYSHAPEPPDNFQQFLRERVKIVRNATYVKSEMLRTPQRGLMGRVLYRVEVSTLHEKRCASYLRALAFYAQYAGVGKKTTHGLGMVYTHVR